MELATLPFERNDFKANISSTQCLCANGKIRKYRYGWHEVLSFFFFFFFVITASLSKKNVTG